MISRLPILPASLPLLSRDQVTRHTPPVGLVEHFHGQHLEWAAIDAFLCSGEPLQSVVSLAAVGWSGVEDDLAVECPRLWVPIGRIGQVTNLAELVQAVKMGKDLPVMRRKLS